MASTYKGMQKYELKGVVGEGAYGKVFMARNKETGEVGKCSDQPDQKGLSVSISTWLTCDLNLFQLRLRNLKSPTTMKSSKRRPCARFKC